MRSHLPARSRVGRPAAQATGLIVTLTQIGYGLGLVLLVPLGDLVENRAILGMIGLVTVSLSLPRLSDTAGSLPRRLLAIGVARLPFRSSCPWRPIWHRPCKRGGSSATS